MLKREMYTRLLSWKKDNTSSQVKKALLITGARQVGKTFLIQNFAETEYKNYTKFDFFLDKEASEAFSKIKTADDAIRLISLKLGNGFKKGNTLVFLDEVQEAQDVITFSKYIIEDGRFDLILSGSMLGVELNSVKSFPVGYLAIEKMYPMTFFEFCDANDVPKEVFEAVEIAYKGKTAVHEIYHHHLINLFHRYIIVGGMPRVVSTYLKDTSDFGATRQLCQQIVELYREDIAKYSHDRTLAIKKIYEEIPSQLDKENKRFQITSLSENAKFDRHVIDFDWIVNANVGLGCTQVTDPKPMLRRTAQYNRFKLYYSDVGMLMSNYPYTSSVNVLTAEKKVNYGQVYENFFAQELVAQGSDLWYYNNRKKGEVDFLLETNKGSVLPVEIKSGKDYKIHLALNNLLKNEEFEIPEAIVLSEKNVSSVERGGKLIHYLPIYMAQHVAEETLLVPKDNGIKLPKLELNWDIS